MIKHGEAFRGKHSPEWTAWRNMITRCHYPSHNSYPNYGGRGISVCDEWRSSYVSFLRDVGRKPTPQHSLDRIDNQKNYEPGNVRWATRTDQNLNKTNAVLRDIDDKPIRMKDIAYWLAIPPSTLRYRLRHHGVR